MEEILTELREIKQAIETNTAILAQTLETLAAMVTISEEMGKAVVEHDPLERTSIGSGKIPPQDE